MATNIVIQQYFDKRRTFANAVFNCGANIAYFCLPPFFRWFMDTFGWQGTLLMVGGLFLEATVCGAIMRPVKKTETHPTSQDVINLSPKPQKKFMGFPAHKLVAIILFTIGDLTVLMGYRVYLVYTPMRCDMLGVTKTETAWLFTIFGIVGLPAKPLVGFIGDRPGVDRTYMYGICAALAGSLTLVTTSMKTFQPLIASSVLFGLLAGNFGFQYFMHKQTM